MKLLIELPTWLGDTIMATPAIENLIQITNPDKISLFGSSISINLLKNMPNVTDYYIDNTKGLKRPINIYKIAKKIGKNDIAISFRSHFYSKLLLYFTNSKEYYIFKSENRFHQVEEYNNYINRIFKTDLSPKELKLPFKTEKSEKRILGINPGASYGSAKRWYPEEFAKVINSLCNSFDKIIIFGSNSEITIANSILNGVNCEKCINMAGKTTLEELIKLISSLTLFITNDSGPMHIASVFKIPTIAIFGATDFTKTNSWKNPNSYILTKNLPCSPCKKRVCPLKTHDCMKQIKAEDVLTLIKDKIE